MGEEQGYLPFPENFQTICVHHTEQVDQQMAEALTTPIVPTNIFRLNKKGSMSKFVQGRLGNSTRSILENVLALLSNAKYGLCFSSGIGAITAAMIGLLKPGDRVCCCDDLYGGTTELLMHVGSRLNIGMTHMDFTNLSTLEEALRPDIKLFWTENPSNPKLKIVDLVCTAQLAKKHNILLATDNTFLTPYLQKPLDLGVDVAVLSLTKYINGHSDVIMGAVVTNRTDLYKKLKHVQTYFGHVPCPIDCYQILRGLKTLPIRMKRHQFNSLEIAKFLESHPKVESVMHPGLKSHPQYELFKTQSCGHSGMIGFYLKSKTEQTINFMNGLQYFTHAVSLGGYESLVEMPSLTSHSRIPPELKKRMRYTDNLIRMSVGLENVCDLINDLDQSLAKM